jgi:predicted phage baseplate assembly protein
VNEVEWEEADNLFILGPRDREYITQTDDSGQTAVIFGTGDHGVRVPTGTANVKAVYRSGTGSAGNVAAQQISQLATQPLGAKGVINPLPATGGADRDTLDQARSNVPIAVMALDRLVSVEDYANFTRTYAGIGKASSARLTDGRRLVVHVTIAGKEDIPIDQNSDLYRNLGLALSQFGDPYLPIQVALRRLKLLVISAALKVQDDYTYEDVATRVRAALLAFYAFDQRGLGQSAFLSEAIAVMQGVAGVKYVDVQKFAAVPEAITAAQLAGLSSSLALNQFVQAELARVDPTVTDPAQRILPAELAILSPDIPDTLILTEITV